MNKKIRRNAFSLIELSIVILIVGILVAGVTQSSSLVRKFRLNTAIQMTKNSPVPSINNLAMWLETTGENSFINSSGSKNISDGDSIQTWVDSNPQSISKILVTQTATDRRPTFAENVINGIPVVRFSEDFFATTLANSGSADMTVFIVARNSDSGAGGSRFDIRRTKRRSALFSRS
jgi:prepilin-type N-terminal cleavage/methylation domain-containing protein